MKKLLSVLVALILLMTCLTACAANEGPTDTKPAGSKPTDTQPSASTPAPTTEPKDNLVEIDFFAGVIGASYRAVSGSGYLGFHTDVSEIDYDKTNSDLRDFLKSVKLIVEMETENEKLHNGDVITITLEYSHSTAEALGITFKEVSKTYTASGFLEPLRTPTQEAFDLLYPELEHAVETSYFEEANPTLQTAYWIYAYDNCGDPYVAGMAALFSYISGGFTEYDLRLVHMHIDGQNLMEDILNEREFWLEYENQSGITLQEAQALMEAVFTVSGLCFPEVIN